MSFRVTTVCAALLLGLGLAGPRPAMAAPAASPSITGAPADLPPGQAGGEYLTRAADCIAGHDSGIAGAVLISVGRSFSILPSGLSRADLVDRMEENLNNKAGMHTVGDTTAEELADEVIRNNVAWDLNQFAGSLAKHPLFVISSDDGGASANNQLAAAVAAHPGANVTTRHFATDHGYDDQRVSLASAVVLWLEKRAPESSPRGGDKTQ